MSGSLLVVPLFYVSSPFYFDFGHCLGTPSRCSNSWHDCARRKRIFRPLLSVV